MRKALVVGIDYYEHEHISNLTGCVADAHAVKAMLDRHADGSINFGAFLLTGTGVGNVVGRQALRQAVQKLFSDDSDVSLFYFAGHGYLEATGGYLCAGDCRTGDDGLPLAEILTMANNSRSKNKIIILDSCHSGIAGVHPAHANMTELSEGMTILTASTAEQYAQEENGVGVFTGLLVDALSGAAANLVGDVTPGGVYAHVDQSLGPWSQRPVFKTNVKNFVSLRKVQPPLPLSDLRRLSEFFPSSGFEFQLDPAYEPERPVDDPATIIPSDPEKNAIFAVLQKYNRVNLLVPNGVPHMWHAAMQSKTCRLTVLGEHYRSLVAKDLI